MGIKFYNLLKNEYFAYGHAQIWQNEHSEGRFLENVSA